MRCCPRGQSNKPRLLYVFTIVLSGLRPVATTTFECFGRLSMMHAVGAACAIPATPLARLSCGHKQGRQLKVVAGGVLIVGPSLVVLN